MRPVVVNSFPARGLKEVYVLFRDAGAQRPGVQIIARSNVAVLLRQQRLGTCLKVEKSSLRQFNNLASWTLQQGLATSLLCFGVRTQQVYA